MSKKTQRSKDAARTPGTNANDPALTRAKSAARRVIVENIARIEASERAAAGAPQTEPAPQREPVPGTQGPEGSPKAEGSAKKRNGGKKPAATKGTAGAKPAKASKPAKAPKTAKPSKAKKLSCLDAAAQIIGKDPIGCADLIAEMAQKRLWTSPSGKTPEASLYAAIIREISAKKGAARFKKVDRGLFVKNA